MMALFQEWSTLGLNGPKIVAKSFAAPGTMKSHENVTFLLSPIFRHRGIWVDILKKRDCRMTERKKPVRDFERLHKEKQLFLLPNAWDVGSAVVFENKAFKCLATTSAAVAYSNVKKWAIFNPIKPKRIIKSE
jgi:hypothetical protein